MTPDLLQWKVQNDSEFNSESHNERYNEVNNDYNDYNHEPLLELYSESWGSCYSVVSIVYSEVQWGAEGPRISNDFNGLYHHLRVV